jgi:hypothetical protein
VRLWRRYNLTLVVADGVKALDTAISRSGIKVARQTCLVHLKRSRRVRVLLDLLLSLASRPHPGFPPLLPPRPQGGPSSGQTTRPVFQLPPGEFGKCHSSWRIARAIALNYNLSTYHLALVIILQDPYFFVKWSNIFNNFSIE